MWCGIAYSSAERRSNLEDRIGRRARFSAYLKESEQGLVIGTRNGKAVAALVAVRDDEELERLVLAHSPRL